MSILHLFSKMKESHQTNRTGGKLSSILLVYFLLSDIHSMLNNLHTVNVIFATICKY